MIILGGMQVKWHLSGMAFLALIVFSGCNQDEEPRALEDQENQHQLMQVENSSENAPEELSNNEIASHLANIAAGVPNVNDAYAVVAGPYAVVAIDVDEDLDRTRVGTVKYSVNEALYHDTYGKTAVVIADADGVERIRGMADKIRQGYPVQGVIEELAAIVGRYMPDFPIPHHQHPENPDQNKELLNEEEEKQLEDIENEQSNHNIDEQNR